MRSRNALLLVSLLFAAACAESSNDDDTTPLPPANDDDSANDDDLANDDDDTADDVDDDDDTELEEPIAPYHVRIPCDEGDEIELDLPLTIRIDHCSGYPYVTLIPESSCYFNMSNPYFFAQFEELMDGAIGLRLANLFSTDGEFTETQDPKSPTFTFSSPVDWSCNPYFRAHAEVAYLRWPSSSNQTTTLELLDFQFSGNLDDRVPMDAFHFGGLISAASVDQLTEEFGFNPCVLIPECDEDRNIPLDYDLMDGDVFDIDIQEVPLPSAQK